MKRNNSNKNTLKSMHKYSYVVDLKTQVRRKAQLDPTRETDYVIQVTSSYPAGEKN
jgi:hypothetical protein